MATRKQLRAGQGVWRRLSGLAHHRRCGEDIDVNFAKSIGPDYWEKRKNVFDFKQDTQSLLNEGLMKTYVGDNQVTFKGAAVRVAVNSTDGNRHATWQVRGAAIELPAVLTNAYGQGRVVYLPAGFDAAYYLYAYPYQRLVLKHAIQWAASAPQPVSVEAPMCVHATTCASKQGNERLIVHLYSDLNTTAFHALPNDDVPLHEEVVPIHDIRVTFDRDYKLGRVHS